jgi:galactosylceramidase
MYTVSTITTASKGASSPKPSSPSFPLPHNDDFEAVVESQEAKYWADQIGAFEVHPESTSESATDGDNST